jgi:restriction endonuclease S subunit
MSMPIYWVDVSFEECISDEPIRVGKVQKKEYLISGQYPVIDQSQEFISGYTNEANLVYQGDLPVILFGDHTLAFKYINFPFVCGADGVKVLVPNKTIVDPEYFYFYLRNLNIQSRGYSRHYKQLRKKRVVLPPISEQKRITKVLREADVLRQWRLDAMEKSTLLLVSLFDNLFGDYSRKIDFPVRKLESIAEVVSGVAKGRRLSNSVTVPYLRVANVQAGYLDLSEIKTIEALAEEVAQLVLKKGDVLLTEGGDFDKLGRGALLDVDLPKNCIHQNHIFRVRVDERYVTPTYFSAYLQTSYARAYFLRASKRTTNLASINLSQLKALSVPVPPRDLQEKFAQMISTFRSAEQAQATSAIKLDVLFYSLQSRSFTGELTASWREKHKEELQRSAVERDKALGLRGEKARLIDFEEGRVTPEELEVLRKALGNFAANLASFHSEMFGGTGQPFEEITKSMAQSLVSISQNLITPVLESFRQSLQNFKLPLPAPPHEDEINRQIDLLPLPQEKRAIHDVLDAISLRVLKLAHASPAYFTPDDLTFGAITSNQASASLRVLDSLGFVRLVEIDGVLRYHVIDATADIALKPNQLQQ